MGESVVAVLGRGLVDPSAPVLLADDLGLSRGDGCFETCRVVTDRTGASEIHNIDAHLARLGRSLAQLQITADVEDCRSVIMLAVDAWTRPGEASVKLMVTRGVDGVAGATVIATLQPSSRKGIRQRATGVRVVTLARGTSSCAYDDAGWLLGGVKLLSYAVNMAALREAERRGADDVLWISTDETVLEAPTATVVWLVGDCLRTTPTGASGILAGTTMAGLFQAAAADGFDTGVAQLRVDELGSVKALWLVSSVRGVVEVVEIDGRARSAPVGLTPRIQTLAGF